MPTILIVEDDEKLAKILKIQLEHEGLDVENSYTGLDAIERIENHQKFDLILLDLGLPDLEGNRVCKAISSISTIPIIVVSARSAIEEKVELLTIGAVDYVTKPFDMLELGARIKVHLKKDISMILKYKGLEMDSSNYIIKKDDEVLSLSKTEFDLLKLFLLNKETLLKRERIISDIWGWNASSNLLDVTIKNLRQKLGKDYIQTIRGIGYSLKKG
ncbi:MAG: response regulator transcription factor [Sebaldella sp.]|nr:response regulator transcription factor [Sebaldella sp.]